MSILIKGMEMPKSCITCFVPCDLIFSLSIKERKQGRHKDCPLADVPTPHGDLIDKDEILYYFEPYKDGSGSILKITAPTVIEKER